MPRTLLSETHTPARPTTRRRGGSLGTGFRAPSLQQINYSSTFTNVQGTVISEVKIAPDYSPLWEAQPYEWTANAIARGFRGLLNEEFRILTLVQDGILTGPGGAKFGTGSFVVNCPIVQRLN